MMQGYPPWLLPWRALGIPDRQRGLMIGNAMTLPVVMNVLPILLLAGGVVDRQQYLALSEAADNFSVCGPPPGWFHV